MKTTTLLSHVDRGAAFVLARMVASEDARARARALRRVDPWYRSAVERRVQAALDDALRAAPKFGSRDLERLALLDVLDRLPPHRELDDLERVRAIHATIGAVPGDSGAVPPDRAGVWTRSMAVLLVLIAAAAGVGAYLRSREPLYSALEPSGREHAGAFRRGGRPRHDSHIREAFATTLPQLGIDAARVAREGGAFEPRFAAARRLLRRASLARALGSFPADALHRLVDVYGAHQRGEATDADVRGAITRLNASLAKHGLGYRVEPLDLDSTAIGLATFEVLDVGFRRPGRTQITVLRANRLDGMNAVHASYGVVERDVPFIVLPLDRADRDMTTRFLPLLDDPPVPTLMPASASLSRFPWLESTHRSAHMAVTRALVRGACGRAVMRTEALLAERRSLILQWSAVLQGRGVSVALPDRYRIDIERYRRNADTNPRFSALEANYEALGSRPRTAAFACARDKLIESFEPALLQRYRDERRTELLPVPASVMDLAESRLDEDAARHAMQHTVRSVRAALASLAESPSTADLTITVLVRCWTHGGSCLRHDEDAARIVFAEVARQLGIPRVGNLRAIGSARIAELYRELVDRGPVAVSRAAAGARDRLFGSE